MKLKYHLSNWHILGILFIILFALTNIGQAGRFDSAVSNPELTALKGDLSDAGLYSIKYDAVNRGLIFNHSASGIPVKIQWTNGGSQILIAVTLIDKYSGIPLTRINASYYTGKLLYENGEIQTFKMYVSGVNLIFEFPKFSQVCLGCATSTFTQSWGVNTNSTNNTIAQTINGTGTTSTITITDSKINQSGIYGSVDRTNLSGWWKLDETTGTLLLDSSGNGNNGTWFGNTTLNSTVGKYNTALNFDGMNDYMASTSNSYLGLNNFSIQFIFNPYSLVEQGSIITNLLSSPYRGVRIQSASGDRLSFGKGNITNVFEQVFFSSVILRNTTSDITIVKNNKIAYLHINGVLSDTKNFTDSTISNGSTTLKVCAPDVNAIYCKVNSFDEIRFYNYSLSSSEIYQNYLVGVRELTVKFDNNATRSAQINGSGSAVLPSASGEYYNVIDYFVPVNHTSIDGVNCYYCQNQSVFSRQLVVTGVQDTVNVSETHASGYQQINYSFTPNVNYNYSLLTINMTNYNDAVVGTPVLQNITNRTLSGTYPNYIINFTTPQNGTESFHNISIPYNNVPLVSASDGTFGIDANVTPSCSYSDSENNPLNVSHTLNGVTKYGTCSQDFGLLPFGTYTFRIWANETSNTVPPLQNSTTTSTITVQCQNCTLSGYVNNTLGDYVNGAHVTINGTSAITRREIIVNNTDLCSYNHTSVTCDGSRVSGTTYFTGNNEIYLKAFSHGDTVAQNMQINLTINGLTVTKTALRPLATAENAYTYIDTVIPGNSNYSLTFSNFHHYEWREYQIRDGYYSISPVSSGQKTAVIQAIGYENNSQIINISGNTALNFTMIERIGINQDDALGYTVLGSLLGGILAFVMIRRKRKD